MGADEDLTEATRIALRQAILLLADEHGLSEGEAYQLVSLAGDLRITQLVDQKVGGHPMIPKSLFEGGSG
jgi:acetamidase/formamidase